MYVEEVGPQTKVCRWPLESRLGSLKNFNWSMIDLQCYVNFCCTAKWLSYTSIYILFYILFYYGWSQEIEYRAACHLTQTLQVVPTQMVLGAHFEKSHRIAGCTSATVPSRNTVLQGMAVPFWVQLHFTHHQSETSVLIYPKSEKRLMGISFSTIILKNKSFSLSWASGNIDWRDYSVGLVWSRSPAGITALRSGVLGNPLAAGWR